MNPQTSKALTVLVCAYNEEHIICDKIEDIITNDKKNNVLELVIVDDYSSDATFKKALDYSKKKALFDIVVINNEYEKGKWGALVTGYKHAHGKIICITDADVKIEGDTIENALKVFKDSKVGGVTINQKVFKVKNGVVTKPKVNLYERFRNFFRSLESRIDSTPAFHGQCLFFRKLSLELTKTDSMADDIDIAIKIRRNNFRTIFCKDSYYIEEAFVFFDRVSRDIFQRRATAVTQVIMKNRDILFNKKYGKYGLISFPIEFFINIVAPFIAVLGAVWLSLFLLSLRYKFLFLVFVIFFIASFKFVMMGLYQLGSVVGFIFNPRYLRTRWSTPRDTKSQKSPE